MDEFTTQIRARVAALGFELVDVRKGGTGRRTSLQVRIDRAGSTPLRGVTIDDCARVSRDLEGWLEREHIVGPKYVLEVSSPGVERPIRWREHWVRFVGCDVRVRVPERGRVKATIVRVLDDAVVLRVHGADGGELEVALDDARDATLMVDWSTIGRPAEKSDD